MRPFITAQLHFAGPASSSSYSLNPLTTRAYAVIKAKASKGVPKSAGRGLPTIAPDSRNASLQQILYPRDSYSPTSASPTGAYQPKVYEKIHAIIHHPEVHETIERAWNLHQRIEREGREKALQAKYEAMQEAMDELERITKREDEGGSGLYYRGIYHGAAMKNDPHREAKMIGKRANPETRWKEARIEGLVPREAWVPTETRGKGWNYGWKRPEGE